MIRRNKLDFAFLILCTLFTFGVCTWGVWRVSAEYPDAWVGITVLFGLLFLVFSVVIWELGLSVLKGGK